MKITLLVASLALAPLSAARTAVPTSGQEETAQESRAQESRAQESLDWFEGSFEDLLAKAKEEQRPIFLHFWAKWSRKSIELNRVYQDPAVIAALDGWICYSIDSVLKPGRPSELARRFNAEKPPRLLFLDSEGNVIDHLLELSDERAPTADELVTEIERIKAGKGTIPALAEEVAAAPDDLMLRWRYAKKLRFVGDQDGFDEQVAEIRKRDPQEESLPLRWLRVEGWQAILTDYTRTITDARKGIAAAELAEFLADETHPRLLYEGWSSVASYWSNQALHAKRSYEHDDARRYSAQFIAALRKTRDHVTEEDLKLTGAYTPALIYQFRDYVDDDAKELALTIAEQVTELMPKSSDALDSYACALYMNGRKAEAVETIRRARELDPSNWILQERLKEFE